MNKLGTITVSYLPKSLSARFARTSQDECSSAWSRISSYIISRAFDGRVTDEILELSWIDALDVIREFGSKFIQRDLGFRFKPEGEALEKLSLYAQEVKSARSSAISLSEAIAEEDIPGKLTALGFTKRTLRPFQLRDVCRLAALHHGANFSVPGAGKTTVTFALHLLTRTPDRHLFVVCPKAAFGAWKDVVDECMEGGAVDGGAEEFILLNGSEEENEKTLRSGAKRFIMSYELVVRQQGLVAAYMARNPVHLVLDEAHRIKAGLASMRGAFLLNIAALPVRRDILTGTPMPQDATDIASQLNFLWPGQGLDLQIRRGTAPRNVLGNLYVRTTKKELGLPPAKRHFYNIDMEPGQKALYSVVRSEALRQLTKAVGRGRSGGPDYIAARRSVMRLLQISSNPTLALQGMLGNDLNVDSGIVDTVLEEAQSAKMRAVVDHARTISRHGGKAVIWTIFTNSILDLETALADLNPVTIYGAVPSGDKTDLETREGRIHRFHQDAKCQVIIANPAAAGEGISLHTVCHDAIYLDRSYVSTHYLQSIDRIHRLGLPEGQETNIHIYRSVAPASLGSVDMSVSRRLATKIRNMQELLNDQDLHEIALDEEEADDPVDYDIDIQDLVDLVEELEGRAGSGMQED